MKTRSLVSSDGQTWTVDDSDNTYKFVDIDLSGFTMSSQFSAAFDANMNHKGDKLFIDDIQVVGEGP